MRIIFVLFTLIFFQNLAFAQQKKDYFELLIEQLENSNGNLAKINTIISRETAKYKDTGEKKFLVSSKCAKLFLQNSNDFDLLSKNYEIYALDIKEFPYLSIRIQYKLSLIFTENKMPDKALFYVNNAIEEAKKQHYVLYLAYLLHRKGNVLLDKKDFGNSRKAYMDALTNYQKVKDTTNIASIENSIGEIFFEQGNLTKAHDYFRTALQTIGSKRKFSDYDNYILNGIKKDIGAKYAKTGNFDNAEKYLNDALNYFKNKPRYESEIVSLIKDLSNLYTNFSKTEKNNQLIAYSRTIEPNLRITNNKIIIADLLLKHYFGTNNKVEEQKYINKLVELNLQHEREWNTENRKITDILNKKIISDIDSKNREKIQDQRKKYFWIVLTSLLASAILVILFIALRNKRKREKLLFEKEKLIEKQNKIILENNIKVQNEKIKNLHLNLNLKNQTEKAFLQKLKTMRKSPKNVDEMMKDLYFNMHNLLQIDKKNTEFTEESYLQNKIFIEKLKTEFPKLNDKELQLCVYIKLGLEPKEIAIIENTTNGNIRVKKSMVKTKLGLTTTDNLDDFLKNI